MENSKTPFHIACKEGQFDVELLNYQSKYVHKTPKNRARGNRKTLKDPK